MPLSRRTKLILFGFTACVAALVAMFVFSAYPRIHKWGVEGRIHGEFYPVLRALDEYEHDHGAPASDLAQLVPKYIPQIPSSGLVDSVEYTVIDDGKAWQLRIHSVTLDPPRSYYSRSNDKYTAEEEARMIIRYHGRWVVLKD